MLTEEAYSWFREEFSDRHKEFLLGVLHDWFLVKRKKRWRGHHMFIEYEPEIDKVTIIIMYSKEDDDDFHMTWQEFVELARGQSWKHN